MSETAPTLRVGQVAERVGVNVQTLRYYERRGLLPAPDRTPAGYRAYPPDTIEFLRSVKRAQELGFRLSEIEDLIRIRRGDGAPEELGELVRGKLSEIDTRIRGLEELRASLHEAAGACGCAGDTSDCRILEGLDAGRRAP